MEWVLECKYPNMENVVSTGMNPENRCERLCDIGETMPVGLGIITGY